MPGRGCRAVGVVPCLSCLARFRPCLLPGHPLLAMPLVQPSVPAMQPGNWREHHHRRVRAQPAPHPQHHHPLTTGHRPPTTSAVYRVAGSTQTLTPTRTALSNSAFRYCVIDGQCVALGVSRPPSNVFDTVAACQVCYPAASKVAYTQVTNGLKSCDDNEKCTYDAAGNVPVAVLGGGGGAGAPLTPRARHVTLAQE